MKDATARARSPEAPLARRPEGDWPAWLARWAPLAAPIVVAAALRLVGLGHRPLSPEEARVALAGWGLWRESPWTLELSPVLPNVLSLLFAAFSGSDGLARLPSALVGATLAAAPLLLARELGAGSALAAAWLLALSPLLALSSRLVSGIPLALLGLALAVAAVARWTRAVGWSWPSGDHDRRGRPRPTQPPPDGRLAPPAQQADPWLAGAGAALALSLGSSDQFGPWLVAAALAALAAWGPQAARDWLRAAADRWRAPAAGFAAVVVALHLRLFTTPAGLHTGLVEPLWRLWPDLSGGLEPRRLVLLATLEAPLLVLAVVSVWLFWRQGLPRFARFLGMWLLLSLPLALVPRPQLAEALVPPLLPAALLGGRALGEAWRVARAGFSLGAALAAATGWVPLGYFLVAALAVARQREAFPMTELLITVAALVLIGALVSGWLASGELRAAGLLLAGSVGLLLTLSFLGRLALRQDVPPPLPGEWALPGLRRAAEEALVLARQRPDEALTVQTSAARWVGWSLRGARLSLVEQDLPSSITLVEPQPLRAQQAAPAGVTQAIGVRIVWAGDAPLRAWWSWVAHGTGWVVQQPYGIIARRS